MNNFNDVLFHLSEQIHPLLWNFLVLFLAIVIGVFIKFVIVKFTAYYKTIDRFSFFKSTVKNLGKPLNMLLPLFVFNVFIPVLKINAYLLAFLTKTVEIAFIIAFAYLFINLIKVLQDYIIYNYSIKSDDNLKERKIITQLQFIRKFLMALIILLAIAAVLFSFDTMRKIGAGLLTSVGIGGIIVGFAAQKSLGNLLAGFQIAFTQPIRIDDVLVVEGEWGRVEEITLTYVVIHIWDERRLILPINYFIEKPFQNWTRTTSEILGTVFIYTDYSIPIDKLRMEFDRLLTHTPLWDKNVKAMQVTDSKENTIEIRALMSAINSSNAFDLRCYIRENLVKYIQENFPESLPKLRTEIAELNNLQIKRQEINKK